MSNKLETCKIQTGKFLSKSRDNWTLNIVHMPFWLVKECKPYLFPYLTAIVLNNERFNVYLKE